MTSSAERWRKTISGERGGAAGFLLRRMLWLARGPYALGVWWRNRRFDKGKRPIFQAPVPVVSVGNLTVGGTGKTPCVEWIAGFYRDLGLQVAILSRGYGAESGRNDEAMLLEENLPDVPHLQGADRVELAKTAIEELESEILVLDDGFQHRRLHRDLNLVLVDATEPNGHGYLLPRGTLREPMANLRRANAVILTRCDAVEESRLGEIEAMLRLHYPNLPIARTRHQPIQILGCVDGTESIEDLRGKAVAGFCGIGNPAAFRKTLEGLGANVIDFRTFPDHHPYSRDDVAELSRWADSLPMGTMAITTQKDWVKLRISSLGSRALRAIRIGLDFLAGREMIEELLRACQDLGTSVSSNERL